MRSINLRTGAIMIVIALIPVASVSQSLPTAPVPGTDAPVAAPATTGLTQPSPTSAAPQTPPAQAILVPAPSPAALITPVPQASASPSPYGYSFDPPVPPVNAPRIIEIDMTDKVVRPGLMQVRVLADPTVTSVVVRALGRSIDVPQTAAGTFAAESTVPSIPFFVRGRVVWVDFVASRQDGTSTVVSLPVTLS